MRAPFGNSLFGTRASEVLGVTSGLRRRLLVMLITPLILLALINAWFDYRSADKPVLPLCMSCDRTHHFLVGNLQIPIP